MKRNAVYLSLGSNMGDKEAYLKQAVQLLEEVPDLAVTAKSSLYLTEPLGFREQDFFLNAVLAIETMLEPRALLTVTQEIEHRLARKRTIRWGPRTMDIDILLYNADEMTDPELVIPHPEMHRRRFVLAPLAEINPNLVIPGKGEVSKLLEECQDTGRISLVQKPNQW